MKAENQSEFLQHFVKMNAFIRLFFWSAYSFRPSHEPLETTVGSHDSSPAQTEAKSCDVESAPDALSGSNCGEMARARCDDGFEDRRSC